MNKEKRVQKGTLLLMFTILTSTIVLAAGTPYTPDPENDYLVDLYDKMPFKDQRAIKNWVIDINNNYQPEKTWETSFVDGSSSAITYKCLSYGASSVNDWFNLQYGATMPNYKSIIRGTSESGTNPRLLEAVYHERVGSHKYYSYTPWISYLAGVYYGPITNERIPYRLEGYASMLGNPPIEWINQDDSKLSNPKEFNYTFYDDMFNIDDFYEIPIEVELLRGTYDEDRIKEAMEKYGALLSFTEKPDSSINVHSVALVGYGADEIGTYFIAHDNYGSGYDEHKKLYIEDIDQVFAFSPEKDWPTNRHDNRRTGFTLLKGDMESARDMDSINFFLTNAQDQEYVVRSSIADLDNNGYMEAVSVAHEKYDSVIGNLFSVERKKKWEWCPSYMYFCWQTKQKWVVGLNRSVLSPPTLGDIDSTTRKEVVVPRRNSSLLVFDVGSNGESVSQLWEFITPSKYSADLDQFHRGELSGSAIADIDLDGTADVIFTDWFSRTIPDWPAQVYVFDGEGNHLFNATFGNGGAYGSPSIANIDEDDYPEVIIPSFYGVFVYDYDPTNSNFSLRWNNSDGLIEGEVVVYDIDRDNEYELIYSTSSYICDSEKTCYNRTYIRDAKTGANEGASPISYNLYTRVAPTIANLDSDSNNEVIVIGTDAKSSNLGKLITYDGNTGSKEWEYNDGGSLQVAFASPDIADITGDGEFDIIFAENNGSKVYILKKDGSLDFTYTFSAFIDNALAIGDLDGDGKAEIALKRAGSPVAFSILSGFNDPPALQSISNVTGVAGDLININVSGEILALEPDGDSISYSYGSPFNGSGFWQTTVTDAGNYSVVVEASDGNLSDYTFVDVFVFDSPTNLITTFSDDSSEKLLNFTQAGNQTVQVRIPINVSIVYSRLKVGGYNS